MKTILEGLREAGKAGVTTISFVDTGYGPELEDGDITDVIGMLEDIYESKRLYDECHDTAKVVTAEIELDEKIAKSSAPEFWDCTCRGICKDDLAPELYIRDGVINALVKLASDYIDWDVIGEEEE